MAETVRAALADATRRINVSETPRLDAELLMAHLLGMPRNTMLMAHLEDAVPEGFEALIARRLAHEPIAAMTGTRGFWTIDLQVGPGAFIPRADTETLLEVAVEFFGARAPAKILDLGTGPGTLLLAALDQWPQAQGVGVERSPDAIRYAHANAERLGFTDRARIQPGIWAEGIDERFDLVLCNPPYVATSEPLPDEVLLYEPAMALFGGPDGLDDYRRVIPELPRLIAPGGCAVLEIGWTQAEAVSALAVDQGFSLRVRNDLGGRPRAVLLT
ncbi:MAG: peptide chain release factor N(5)-glutamine methyltransferase [Pseudomonadota bacterium]